MIGGLREALEALESLSVSDRLLITLPSGRELARIITSGWDLELTMALANPGLGRADLADIVRNYDPALILQYSENGIAINQYQSGSEHPRPLVDSCITVFTSGTTGAPKGVVLPRSAVKGNAIKTATLHGLGNGRPHGSCLELFHVNALVMSLIGTHETGERLALDYSGPVSYFEALRDQGVRTASVNPVKLARIVEAQPPWPDSLDYLITAAGPCSSNLARSFHELYGPRLRQGYGLSEAVNFSFMMPLLDTADFRTYYLGSRPPVGLPLPGTEFVIDDEELFLRTPDVMLGYLLQQSPSNIDAEGWLRTGDYAQMRDGFVVLRGRVADSIRRRRGRQIPTDIEDSLALPDTCGEYAVARIPHDGDDGTALFTSTSWCEPLSALTKPGASPSFELIQAMGLRLGPSGKVERTVMSQQAQRVVAGLEQLASLVPAEVTFEWLSGLHAALFENLSAQNGSLAVGPVSDECTCRVVRSERVVTVVVTESAHRCLAASSRDTTKARVVVAGGAALADGAGFWAAWAGAGSTRPLSYVRTLDGFVIASGLPLR